MRVNSRSHALPPMSPSFLRPGLVPDPLPATGRRIPRQLWQSARDPDNLPPHLAGSVARLRSRNPGWAHRMFSDASQRAFLAGVCSERFMAAYDAIHPEFGPARSDLFRYVVIYLHGGAWFDLKSGTRDPLDAVLRPDDMFLLAQWDPGPGGKPPRSRLHASLDHVPGGEYQQWFVIAAPGHPFLAAVIERALDGIERYDPFVHGRGKKGVLELTGPCAFTLAIHPIRDLHPHRLISARENGLRYAVSGDRTAHARQDPNHYSRSQRPVVSDRHLPAAIRLRRRILELLYLPVRLLREWYLGRDLERRARAAAARRAAREARNRAGTDRNGPPTRRT